MKQENLQCVVNFIKFEWQFYISEYLRLVNPIELGFILLLRYCKINGSLWEIYLENIPMICSLCWSCRTLSPSLR